MNPHTDGLVFASDKPRKGIKSLDFAKQLASTRSWLKFLLHNKKVLPLGKRNNELASWEPSSALNMVFSVTWAFTFALQSSTKICKRTHWRNKNLSYSHETFVYVELQDRAKDKIGSSFKPLPNQHCFILSCSCRLHYLYTRFSWSVQNLLLDGGFLQKKFEAKPYDLMASWRNRHIRKLEWQNIEYAH